MSTRNVAVSTGASRGIGAGLVTASRELEIYVAARKELHNEIAAPFQAVQGGGSR